MHELPATRGMLDAALEAAGEANAERVLAIDVVIGQLTSFVDDAVQFYFDVISEDTRAEGARLRFHREPARVTCHECGHVHRTGPPLRPECPACGSMALQVEGGRDFYVQSIEVEE